MRAPSGPNPPFRRSLPPFLGRWILLRSARRAAVRGDVSGALAELARSELSLSGRADRLRSRVLSQVVRRARRSARDGRLRSAREHLETLAREDPQLSASLAEELGLSGPGPDESRRRALRDLLGSMRSGAPGGDPARPKPAADEGAGEAPRRASPVHLVHMAVDDGGEALLALASGFVMGHASAGQADLGFLADLESCHARLSFRESFHGGPVWELAPLDQKSGPAQVAVNGVLLAGAPRILGAGDRVLLGSNLAFTVDLPDPASASVILRLEGGVECEGAGRIILLAPDGGAGGRVGIGPGRRHHMTVAALDGEAWLTCAGGALYLRRVDASGSTGEVEVLGTVALPLAGAREFRLGARRGGGGPIDLWIRAVDPDPRSGARGMARDGA